MIIIRFKFEIAGSAGSNPAEYPTILTAIPVVVYLYKFHNLLSFARSIGHSVANLSH